jgi:rhodanese-related sulfurtransferase
MGFIRVTFLVGLLAAITAFADQPAPATSKPATAAVDFKAKVLDPAAIDKLLANPEKLLIVDIRRPDELTKIGGFPVYLNVQLKELPTQLAWIPKDRTIVTVSNHAKRAGRAADLLADHGFKVAGAIGVQDYESAGGKIVRIEPPVRPANAPAASAPANSATATPGAAQ